DDSVFPIRLRAQEDGIVVDLSLTPLKPMVLQGDSGLSQKGPGPGTPRTTTPTRGWRRRGRSA
nr:carotenoid 1,2-hydratase [Gemmatimonadota bacterium]NIU73221.1 hypothetical protein [Gammaproteobacteria bacterium]